MWITMAALSAVFAGVTAILAKCGIRKTDSDVATALRTIVVLAFSWLMAFVSKGDEGFNEISAESLVFLVLSGLCTGASWLCYFKALSMGDVSRVVPVDKSSVILTVLAAIVFFGETEHLTVKLTCTAILAVGTLLMLEKKPVDDKKSGRGWIVYALLSALFAAATSILAKIGITGVESNLATAVRTGVVLIMAWVVVFIKGKQKSLHQLDRRELAFISLSGITTGASWLCYYYAIQNGVVSVVVPIDKLSVLISAVFAAVFFKEKLRPRALFGLILLTCATVLMAVLS